MVRELPFSPHGASHVPGRGWKKVPSKFPEKRSCPGVSALHSAKILSIGQKIQSLQLPCDGTFHIEFRLLLLFQRIIYHRNGYFASLPLKKKRSDIILSD
jgi:hypothetical protein